MASQAQSKVTTDHEIIRHWVEERGGHPAAVRSTRGRKNTKAGKITKAKTKTDPGIIRIDMPGYKGARSLEEITWDEFFEKFENAHLAFIYQDKTSKGKKSNFNKLVNRSNVDLD